MIVEQLKSSVDSLRDDGDFERSDFATLCKIGVIVLNEIEPLEESFMALGGLCGERLVGDIEFKIGVQCLII